MSTKQETCEQRVDKELESRLEDLRQLWQAECDGEEGVEDVGSLNEYGLCFDYVPPGTFNDEPAGYFRYQLSTGGPGDEFRFYADPDISVYRTEYVFLDWFDGATRTLYGDDARLLLEIFEWFKECGCVDRAREDAK